MTTRAVMDMARLRESIGRQVKARVTLEVQGVEKPALAACLDRIYG